MSNLDMMDLAQRSAKVAKKGWVSKDKFKPGGEKGKLHRELGISTDKKIPEDRLEKAARSKNPEVRRDAIRAKTMKGWDHSGKKKSKGQVLYDKHKD